MKPEFEDAITTALYWFRINRQSGKRRAFIKRISQQIDENLIRNELNVLERGELLKRRKEIYEAKHPDSKAGVRRANGMNTSLGNNVEEIISPTFASDTANKTN